MLNSHTYTTNQIKLNIPGKVLPVSVTDIEGYAFWPYQNSATDPWWSGGTNPKNYQWKITFTVTAVNHGSNLTRDDFTFNGLDIQVNDWIAGAADPKCLKIIEIINKTRTTITCIVEDWLRYNTFKSPTGNGIFNTGSAVVFTLNEDGLPMLDPIPSIVGLDFYPGVSSRFQYLNSQVNFVLKQENHGFNNGDVISVTTDGFVKANADNASNLIGVVTESGPGSNFFMILPNNRIIDFDPSIPGLQGERIYVDTDGTLSNVQTATNKIVFLNLTGPTPTNITGDQLDPTVPNGTTAIINNVPHTFNGSGSANITNMVNTINGLTSQSKVLASSALAPTVITSSSVGTAYGLVGGNVPFSATINGTLVNFTSSGSQFAGIATPEDMAIDINDANISNLTATAISSTQLTLTESAGGSITIVNGDNDANNNPFVGASNVSGLVATTAATTEFLLTLTRNDGGEILIFESSDVFQTNTGVKSGQNGSLPLAMNIEQGIRTASVTVVADTLERDSLNAQVGDQSYVLDGGVGEWILYLFDGSSWVQVATEDSSTVDAHTVSTTLSGPYLAGGNVTTQNIGSVSAGRKITTVSVEVTGVFAGGLDTPFIEVGTQADNDLFMGPNDSDLGVLEDFIILPEYVHPASSNEELLLQVKLTHFASTTGQVTIKVTYI